MNMPFRTQEMRSSLASHIGTFAAGDTPYLIGLLTLAAKRRAWRDGLDAFAKPSSQRVDLGCAEILSHCS
jgi:hypothetical protein